MASLDLVPVTEQTRTMQSEPPALVSSAVRPSPILTQADSDQEAEAELTKLLGRRVRQLTRLVSIIYIAFVIRDWITFRDVVRVQISLLIVAASLQLLLAVFVQFRPPISRRQVGFLEWTNLGLFWVTLSTLHFLYLTQDYWGPFAVAGSLDAQILSANTWFLPWFAVMAGYPVLVPNRLPRTVLLVGITSILPIAVTIAATLSSPTLSLSSTWVMHMQYLLWGFVGVSIAVYGAHQAGLLRKEVFEAKQFGRYRLVRKIGGGGMGEVYLAEHKLLRRPSVIKLIRQDRAEDEKARRRFEREVRLLATLTHWNTVDVFDYGHTTDGTFYFVMEFLPGMDLHDLVKRFGPLPPARAIYLMRQACDGLREAHAIGLIHRDLKPANIMACQQGGLCDVAKVLDFGLVQDVSSTSTDQSMNREGLIQGTPAYLSVEQALGRSTDARSDIYCLGATLYYLLTGRPVYEKERVLELIAAHINEEPQPPSVHRPEIPPDLDAVVMKCLKKNPADRFLSVKELEQALVACSASAAWSEDHARKWWSIHLDSEIQNASKVTSSARP